MIGYAPAMSLQKLWKTSRRGFYPRENPPTSRNPKSAIQSLATNPLPCKIA
jgi:hypothetical protein